MAKTKAEFAIQRTQDRARLFPKLDTSLLWIPPGVKDGGWSEVPRTMPVILAVLEHVGEKGGNLVTTYIDLWSLDKGEGFFDIVNPYERATMAGFSGSRRVDTWSKRMQGLERLGFIHTASSVRWGEFAHVVIINPHYVIKKLYETSPKDDRVAELYDLLQVRAKEAKCHDAEWLNVNVPWPSLSDSANTPAPVP